MGTSERKVGMIARNITLFILLSLMIKQRAQAEIWNLQQCISFAKEHNKSLKIAKNNVFLGEEKHSEAVANLIPKIAANADYRYYIDLPYQLMPSGRPGQFKETQFGVPHTVNANLQLTIPLYNPQAHGALQTTTIAHELSKLQQMKTQNQVYFEIANLYFNAQLLSNQLNFIENNLKSIRKVLENINLLRSQLLATNIDVKKVELQLTQLSNQEESVRDKRDQVLRALKFSMGISFDQDVTVDKQIKYEDNVEKNDSPSLEIDELIAKKQNSLVVSELSTARHSLLPTLSLYALYGTNGFGFEGEPEDFLKFYPVTYVGIQLSLPLFDGGVTLQRIDQKKIELQSTALQIDLASEQSRLQMENAKQQRIQAKKMVDSTLTQIELAQAIFDQAQLQQKQGTASLTDILLADNSLRETQQNYLSSVIDYFKADLEIKRLSGIISNERLNQ